MRDIVLDKKTFEALAMESRVKIMKALKERRKTQAELSKELNLAPSTVSEHLEKMLEAGLISKHKDHHKWIYYELSEKGQTILSPQKANVFVFALSLTLFVTVVGYIFLTFTAGSFLTTSPPEPVLGEKAAAVAGLAQAQPDYLTPSLMVVAAVLLVVALIFFKRMRK